MCAHAALLGLLGCARLVVAVDSGALNDADRLLTMPRDSAQNMHGFMDLLSE